MKIVSNIFALSLYKFEELPEPRKRDIEYYQKNPISYPSKGDVDLYKTSDNDYLTINTDLWGNSKIKEIYGDRQYRTNDDSFDTLMNRIFFELSYERNRVIGKSSFSTHEVIEIFKGFELILNAWSNDIWKFYHWLLFVDDFLDKKFDNSLLKTIKFFNIVELLIFEKSKNNRENCKDKLPQYLLGTMPEFLQIWPNYLWNDYKPIAEIRNSEKICEKIAIIRNKVTHDDFQKVIDEINDLYDKGSLTEDAESNGIFDQIRKYNMILDNIIVNIFEALIDSPNRVIN
ncbi:TPA: hypothetical protein U2C13_001788 [Streptococcus suis]|nr:hypothetical protein [Streptococcus suis]HEM6138202.1 hypothetical protein [Streptococcus suis]